MSPWLRVLEAYLIQALLRTPAFHRAVEKVAKGVHRIRHGAPPEELGGTKIDQPGQGNFLRHFGEEIQTQLGRVESKTAVKGESESQSARASGGMSTGQVAKGEAEEESADAVWRAARKNAEEGQKQSQSFLGEYAAALREQVRRGK